MKISYLFLAEGFEEIEALATIDVLRRAGMELKTVSITSQLEVKGAHDIIVFADKTFDADELADAEWLIMPGGMLGATNLGKFKPLIELLENRVNQNENIAAICAAPALVLGEHGLLEGRKATCYPGFEKQLKGAEYTGNPVETDKNIITGNGPGSTIAFASAIVSKSMGQDIADAVKQGMMVEP